MKTCKKCGIEKEESEYFKDKSTADGLTKICKECQGEREGNHKDSLSDSYVKKMLLKRGVTHEMIAANPELIENKRQEILQIRLRRQELSKLSPSDKKRMCKREYEKNNLKAKQRKKSNTKKRKQRAIDNVEDTYIKKSLRREGLSNQALEEYPLLIQIKRVQILNHRALKQHTQV